MQRALRRAAQYSGKARRWHPRPEHTDPEWFPKQQLRSRLQPVIADETHLDFALHLSLHIGMGKVQALQTKSFCVKLPKGDPIFSSAIACPQKDPTEPQWAC